MTTIADTTRHWSDEPLGAEGDDVLGRQGFVDTVVARVELAKSSDSSTVFGLIGPWGSGKSSVITKVRAGLSQDWLVGDFTPWSSGDSAAMSLEFVRTLSALLGTKAKGEVRQLLAQYAGYVSPLLAAVPLVGAGVKGTVDELLEAFGSRPPWHEQFQAISDAVQGLNKRVLIVVDDVDRLGGDELLTLLRVVRLLGRFRGVHYLIAYDQETVEDLLASTGSVGRSTAFMEKIVQYPFEVPPISPAAAIRLMNETVRDVLSASDTRLTESGLERSVELVNLLAPEIETPRALGRFAEQLRAFAGHVKTAELDALDYIAVTWLRLSAHGVWLVIPKWHGELTTGRRPESVSKSVDIGLEEWRERIRRAAEVADEDAIIRVLSFLFPGVNVSGFSYFSAHELALSDESYFGRYMLLAQPENDVSDELIRVVLSSLLDRGETSRIEELAAAMDGSDDIANLAYSRAARLRRPASSTSRQLLVFLSERLASRRDDSSAVGAPRNSLRTWIAREVAIGVDSEIFNSEDVINWFGEDESFTLVLLASRIPEFKPRAKRLAEGFAKYWIAQVHARSDEFLGAGSKLGGIADLAVFAGGADAIGMLDFAVTDVESYLRVAQSFVVVQEWVGSGVTYALAFRHNQFAVAVSERVRLHYAREVAKEKTDFAYELEDLTDSEIAPDVRRAYAIDMVMSQSASLDDFVDP